MFKWLTQLFKQKPNVPLDGFRAYEAGYGIADNPWSKGTANHSIWRDDMLFCQGKFR